MLDSLRWRPLEREGFDIGIRWHETRHMIDHGNILAPGKDQPVVSAVGQRGCKDRGQLFRKSRVEGFAKHGGQFFRRSEEHTSELQSLMRISYAVFCLKKKIHT